MSEENKALVVHWFEEVWNNGPLLNPRVSKQTLG